MKIRLVAANLNFKAPFTSLYRRYLRRHLFPPSRRGALLFQEVGHGPRSTRIRAVRLRLRDLPRWLIGKIGAHRGVARARIHQLRILDLHGLHRVTSGQAAQDTYYAELAEYLEDKPWPWAVGGDFNRSVHEVARLLGGVAHGLGVIGFVTSPGLVVTAEGEDDAALRQTPRWSDHPAYWIDLALPTGGA